MGGVSLLTLLWLNRMTGKETVSLVADLIQKRGFQHKEIFTFLKEAVDLSDLMVWHHFRYIHKASFLFWKTWLHQSRAAVSDLPYYAFQFSSMLSLVVCSCLCLKLCLYVYASHRFRLPSASLGNLGLAPLSVCLAKCATVQFTHAYITRTGMHDSSTNTGVRSAQVRSMNQINVSVSFFYNQICF